MGSRVAIWPSGTRIVWRALTWGEFREARSHQGPPAEAALEVYKKCVIEGPTPEYVAAGVMMWIFQYELEKSPFSGAFQALSLPLEQARQRVSSTYLLSAQAFIASVFKIPFEVMDTWDANTFLTRVAQAEFVSGVPLNPVDPAAAKSAPTNTSGVVVKKPLTNAQQIALERRNDPRNQKSPRAVNKRSHR